MFYSNSWYGYSDQLMQNNQSKQNLNEMIKFENLSSLSIKLIKFSSISYKFYDSFRLFGVQETDSLMAIWL